MRNRYLTLVLLVFMLAVGQSTWAGMALVVHQKSGGTVEFAFSKKPVVTYSGGNVVITSTEAKVEYPLSDVQKFTFSEETDGVERIVAPANQLPQPTYIYNVGGMLMRTLQPNKDGTTPATLEGLPAGTYIIKNGTTKYKIIKK